MTCFPLSDEAFGNSEEGNSTSTTIAQPSQSARSCQGFSLAALKPPPPSYLTTTFQFDDVIQSGFWVYFTCKKTPYPELAYRLVTLKILSCNMQ